jgi:hypothetical protein
MMNFFGLLFGLDVVVLNCLSFIGSISLSQRPVPYDLLHPCHFG